MQEQRWSRKLVLGYSQGCVNDVSSLLVTIKSILILQAVIEKNLVNSRFDNYHDQTVNLSSPRFAHSREKQVSLRSGCFLEGC
jgi:hypothetical protein